MYITWFQNQSHKKTHTFTYSADFFEVWLWSCLVSPEWISIYAANTNSYFFFDYPTKHLDHFFSCGTIWNIFFLHRIFVHRYANVLIDMLVAHSVRAWSLVQIGNPLLLVAAAAMTIRPSGCWQLVCCLFATSSPLINVLAAYKSARAIRHY